MSNFKNQKIAIIGSGITGLACAWHLNRCGFDFRIFEKNARIGGHSNTVDTPSKTPVDTGFIVYNEWTYPNLINLFETIDVDTEASDMSFAISMDKGNFEYAGDDFWTLFGQKRNFFRPRMYSMIKDLLRFYKQAPIDLEQGSASGSLGEYLKKNNYKDAFIRDHLIPMGSAIWSMPPNQMMGFPAQSFIRFCQNHGLLLLTDRPEWRTVTGGSREYVRKITKEFKNKIVINDAAIQIGRDKGKWKLTTKSGEVEIFDQIVFACHGDQILDLIETPTDLQTSVLGAFKYSKNTAYLHQDESLMPKIKKLWSSWNYMGLTNKHSVIDTPVFVTYWMNRLQNYMIEEDYFVSLNPFKKPALDKTIREINYEHPIFDQDAMDAQKELNTIQGVDNLWYCGAWCGYGFHEDGATAGLTVAEQITHIQRPWNVDEKSTAKMNCTALNYKAKNKVA
ncbi:MAG: NAD/FAD-binding protein [Rickettsiales bacterium]|nr:NAD/FAD-binding protein [Rickettsiales bacterium]